jgi:hypothetical protein
MEKAGMSRRAVRAFPPAATKYARSSPNARLRRALFLAAAPLPEQSRSPYPPGRQTRFQPPPGQPAPLQPARRSPERAVFAVRRCVHSYFDVFSEF